MEEAARTERGTMAPWLLPVNETERRAFCGADRGCRAWSWVADLSGRREVERSINCSLKH